MIKTIQGVTIEEWMERKCSTNGCYRYRKTGYVYCSDCLWGHSQYLPDKVIKKLKKIIEMRNNEHLLGL
jgi:Zn-finger protein